MEINAGPISFESSVILITGAARGLGRAYANFLAARGARIILNDIGVTAAGASPSPAVAEQAAAEIGQAGGVAIADCSDVATEAGAIAAVRVALDQFGRIDAVINNAGFVRSGKLADVSVEDFDATVAVHARGAFLVTRAAWAAMTKQGYGRVVMTTSCGALYGQVGLTAYGAAKGAIMGMTRVLAIEGEPLGIRVNGVAPLAYTRLAAGIPDDDHRALFERHARVEQVAPLVGLLAHPACPVNGLIFDAGAGRFARIFQGEGVGYLNPDATIEAVRDHFEEILSDQGFTKPTGADDAVSRTVQLIVGNGSRG
jgi:NAD(P)-dependent dehydrogenase (short-subunit alcohol dehydrogenase family)